MSNLSKKNVYLLFDIRCWTQKKRLGEVQIPIHKESEMDKWKNPDSVKQDAVQAFKLENPIYNDMELDAIYTGDIIPMLKPNNTTP